MNNVLTSATFFSLHFGYEKSMWQLYITAIFQQLKILHGNGEFTPEYKLTFPD